jgi:hypothetical protein
MANKKMNNKGLTSFFMTLGFLLLVITGIILYIVPAGRVANWVNWTLFGLTKTQWGNIHILSGFMLLIAGIFHIYFNWKPLKHYFYSKVQKGINLKKEMVVSLGISIVLVVAAIGDLPPFSYVFDFGDFAKEAWVVAEEYEAPLGHAELLAFDSFTSKLKIDKQKALKELAANGIEVSSGKDSLEKIAKANNIAPVEIYQVIRKFEPEKEEVKIEDLTAEKVEELLEGKGIGRRNINWLLAEFKLEPDKAERRLQKSNIQASNDESFHDIADRYESSPMDIVKVLLVKKHVL